MFRKNLQDLLAELKLDPQVEYWHTMEETEAKYSSFPDQLPQHLIDGLHRRGVTSLYSHQRTAYDTAANKENVVAVTPTASGKTLCYNLPVLQRFHVNPSARALYIFPTKALAQDQMTELNELADELENGLNCYTYDGDTPTGLRQKVRKAGHVVITNPDMLHAAVLPHHTKWISLFENLETIVIDELHTYRGVFGSHVANVIRRLKRICAYYGSNPTFICTSATIANPVELAQELTGSPFRLVDDNGAPRGRKHIIFYNPPIIHEQFHIRKSATKVVNDLASEFLKNQVQTIVFARSRVRVEIILSRLQHLIKDDLLKQSIRGYRGGYLPSQRREIEKGLRSGETIGVVSTNALELGVDIGQLQVCIMTGYPGSIASSWQQAGRAGRRQGESVVIMVAGASPLDQYVFQNPDYFFDHTPETARINKNNLIILSDHIKCAAYELPFKEGEGFDDVTPEDTAELLDYLTEMRVLHHRHVTWHWMSDAFPAHEISLRSAAQENVVIIDRTKKGTPQVIGEMDTFSAMTLLHDEAVYLHEGVQHQVELLDWDEKKAYVREVEVDYFTDANLAVKLTVLDIDENRDTGICSMQYGDVMVTAMATIFKKIKLDTYENIGSGPIHLPELELHTNGFMLEFEPEFFDDLNDEEIEQLLIGFCHALSHVAAVHVMCDKRDIHAVPEVKAVHSGRPVVYLYDSYPGGIGLAQKIFQQAEHVLSKTADYVDHCPCSHGCPACTGTQGMEDWNVKKRLADVMWKLMEGLE
ncbi:DEAD/DEAH box helicase [Bacillus daqingensis]|uniref:DEAD/DEAH box helicase n=1 Tax=Bacillus daqingensis TaxID=872396 RepID=A0ABV9NR51_9BACI